MVPRISEYADWIGRGFRLLRAGHFLASVFGSGLLVAGIINPLADWMGIAGFLVFFLSAVGLLTMTVAAVLGFRDPKSPWQLARRFSQLADRLDRFGSELVRRPLPTPVPIPLAPPNIEAVMDDQQRRQAEFTSRIGAPLGTLVEDALDEGYELPPKVTYPLAWTAPVNPGEAGRLTHDLRTVAEKLKTRRLPQNPS